MYNDDAQYLRLLALVGFLAVIISVPFTKIYNAPSLPIQHLTYIYTSFEVIVWDNTVKPRIHDIII